MVSTRTIFLAVRGIDQTGRAFSIIDRRIERLIQRQMQLQGISRKAATTEMVKDQNRLLFAMRALDRMAYRMIFAGAAFLTFAAMMGWGIMSIIEKSSMGELVIEDFRRAFDKLITSISEKILEDWGPAIKGFIDWLDSLAENEMFKTIFSGLAIPVTIVLGLMAVTLLVTGIIGKFLALLVGVLETAGFVETGALKAHGVAGFQMAIPILVTFMIGVGLVIAKEAISENIIDPLIDDVIENVGPEYKLSEEDKENLRWIMKPPDIFGGGGGLFGGLLPRQLGTTRIPRTGPILAHEGEWIFNPQLPITPPPQMLGRGAGGPIEINVTQYIDSIGVEADEDRLAQKTAEYIGDEIGRVMG